MCELDVEILLLCYVSGSGVCFFGAAESETTPESNGYRGLMAALRRLVAGTWCDRGSGKVIFPIWW